MSKKKVGRANDATLKAGNIVRDKKEIKIKYIPYKKTKLNYLKTMVIISALLVFIILAIGFIVKNNSKNIISKKSDAIEQNTDKISKFNELIKNNSLIYFQKNTSILNDGEINKVDAIIIALKMCDVANIEISGYTANIEKPENEIFLSQKRADYIKSLIEQKIINDKIKMSAKGYGSSNEVTKDPSKFYLNRRVEIKIIDVIFK
jgi:outer membrane protein OmpA-like peptidoglycan-associated protein